MNRLNMLAWFNLGVRTATQFGLLVVVGRLAGDAAVETWLIVVTAVAGLGTLDALLSEYFMRAFVQDGMAVRRSGPVALQDSLYWAMGIVFAVAGIVLFDALPPSYRVTSGVLLGILAAVRRLESRTRAVASLERIQAFDAIASAVVLGVCLSVAFLSSQVGAMVAAFLAARILASVVKRWLLAPAAPFLGLGYRAVTPVVHDWPHVLRLRDTAVVSLGGALSANIGLMAMSKALPPSSSAPLLLTYRIAMLVAEFGSAPVASRTPLFTRVAVEQGAPAASRVFLSALRVSVPLTLVGLAVMVAGSFVGLQRFDASLRLLPPSIVVVIALAWMVERHNTFLSQFLLCAHIFEHARAYMVLLTLFAAGTGYALWLGSAQAFASFHALANFVAAPNIHRRFRVAADAHLVPMQP